MRKIVNRITPCLIIGLLLLIPVLSGLNYFLYEENHAPSPLEGQIVGTPHYSPKQTVFVPQSVSETRSQGMSQTSIVPTVYAIPKEETPRYRAYVVQRGDSLAKLDPSGYLETCRLNERNGFIQKKEQCRLIAGKTILLPVEAHIVLLAKQQALEDRLEQFSQGTDRVVARLTALETQVKELGQRIAQLPPVASIKTAENDTNLVQPRRKS